LRDLDEIAARERDALVHAMLRAVPAGPVMFDEIAERQRQNTVAA
jgi:hypothetical protein